MKEKSQIGWAVVLMLVMALTRWPGLMPWNFSACYALLFCAGIYLPGRLGWWLPFLVMVVTDVMLAFYHGYSPFHPFALVNWVAYLALTGCGHALKPGSALWKIVGGGVGAAFLFYFLTNFATWLFNPFDVPEYTRDWNGLWLALTLGMPGQPPTFMFLINTLLSGGLFTGLFAGAMKWVDASESAAEKKAAEAQVRSDHEGAGEGESEVSPQPKEEPV